MWRRRRPTKVKLWQIGKTLAPFSRPGRKHALEKPSCPNWNLAKHRAESLCITCAEFRYTGAVLVQKTTKKDPNWSKWPFVAQFSRIYSERKSRRIVQLNQKLVFDRLESNRSASAIVEESQVAHNKNTHNTANVLLGWQKEQQLKLFTEKSTKTQWTWNIK